MRKSLGFTLAEVLITLAIIGVVAAMTIPSVIINTNQQEYKTGLKKAVSVLNQAITMNMALENMSPSDTTTAEDVDNGKYSLRTYLAQRLNVIRSTDSLAFNQSNAAFYTADGMRFEFGNGKATMAADSQESGCTASAPCIIMVDVNGDRKPTPLSTTKASQYNVLIGGDKINDIFSIMITDTAAIPFGTLAQNTMFQAD